MITFTEFEKLVSGLHILFQEYVNPDITEIAIGNIVSCVGIGIVLKYLEDLHISYGNSDVVVEYPDNDEQYAKEKVTLLYKTLLRRNHGLNKSSHI